ncbi:TetR/AcrR family transcriptional regulator [Actinacidiphila guanduensis]|uniref:Transcriptional regulator, TetR family n=1 Tax=Actinacidiphila guanduensis TaxID=310781 RepID=A0A1G9VWF1_9ACTN|nr:TetR/AcrR family transcriptional regulator [Actinacidiphila guanduensis]SDM76185.1 transcriptional regulator, TetR family [Actinacidiphila guanduensis]
MAEDPAPARGRKRSEQTRLAILAAAYELTLEVGFAGVTVEGVAKRAGAGKQTVYRWWATKADVLLEALALKADLTVSTADQGSFEAEVDAFLRDSAALLAVPGVVPVLRSLMAEAQRDTDFRHRFQDGFLTRRRAAFETVVARAAARGDKPVHLTAALAADLVFGLIWYRVLATERLLGEDDITAVRRLLSEQPGEE